MTTATTLVDDVLEYLRVSNNLIESDPDQQRRVFTELLRMYDWLPVENIYIQMRRPASPQGELLEPLWATSYLIKILAKKVSPYFPAVQLSQAQMDDYSDAMSMLRARTGKLEESSYPETLPRGAGHTDYWTSYDFYPGDTFDQYALYDNRLVGESKLYDIDFATQSARRGASVSSVEWESIGESNNEISPNPLAGSVAQASVTFNQTGEARIRARATLSNGEIYDGILIVDVTDPEYAHRSTT